MNDIQRNECLTFIDLAISNNLSVKSCIRELAMQAAKTGKIDVIKKLLTQNIFDESWIKMLLINSSKSKDLALFKLLVETFKLNSVPVECVKTALQKENIALLRFCLKNFDEKDYEKEKINSVFMKPFSGIFSCRSITINLKMRRLAIKFLSVYTIKMYFDEIEEAFHYKLNQHFHKLNEDYAEIFSYCLTKYKMPPLEYLAQNKLEPWQRAIVLEHLGAEL